MFRISSAALLLLIGGGCAASNGGGRPVDDAVRAYFDGNYHGAVTRLEPLAQKTDENFVLNNLRLGSAALADYDLDTAEAAFVRAYEVMNSVGVNDGGRSLGAALVDEKVKVWKGEPFERAMANYYLGICYYIHADYNNARAAFENALFKLRDYASDQEIKEDDYVNAESNFALGYVMLAKADQRLGRDDEARKYFQRAGEIRSYLRPLVDFDRNAHANVLLIIDYGHGPEKVKNSDGVLAGFEPTAREQGPVPPPRIIVDGQALPLEGAGRPPVDLLSMAQDQRWQSIDTIRATKSTIGTGLIAGGAGYGVYRSANSRRGIGGGDAAITAGLIGAGLLLKASSQADIRYWEMAPRTSFVLPLELPPGKHDLTIEFPNVAGARQSWRGIIAPEKGEASYYFRMSRWNPGPFDWPPPGIRTDADEPDAPGRSARPSPAKPSP